MWCVAIRGPPSQRGVQLGVGRRLRTKTLGEGTYFRTRKWSKKGQKRHFSKTVGDPWRSFWEWFGSFPVRACPPRSPPYWEITCKPGCFGTQAWPKTGQKRHSSKTFRDPWGTCHRWFGRVPGRLWTPRPRLLFKSEGKCGVLGHKTGPKRVENDTFQKRPGTPGGRVGGGLGGSRAPTDTLVPAYAEITKERWYFGAKNGPRTGQKRHLSKADAKEPALHVSSRKRHCPGRQLTQKPGPPPKQAHLAQQPG